MAQDREKLTRAVGEEAQTPVSFRIAFICAGSPQGAYVLIWLVCTTTPANSIQPPIRGRTSRKNPRSLSQVASNMLIVGKPGKHV